MVGFHHLYDRLFSIFMTMHSSLVTVAIIRIPAVYAVCWRSRASCCDQENSRRFVIDIYFKSYCIIKSLGL